MKKCLCLAVMLSLTLLSTIGCSTAPDSAGDRAKLHADVMDTIESARTQDSGLNRFFNDSHGYAVFPKIAKGASGVGAAWGRGEVFEQGDVIGWCEMTQASIGFQLGGQVYSELIFFENSAALSDFTGGDFEFSAQASAVAVTAGSSANARYENGVAVFTLGERGLMYEASVGGQKFNYEPMN